MSGDSILAPYADRSDLMPEVRTMLEFAGLAAGKLGQRQRRCLVDIRPGQRVHGMPYPGCVRESLAAKGLLRNDGSWELTPVGAVVRQAIMFRRVEAGG